MSSAASWRGAVQSEDDQSNHMTRWHTETPLVVWLLGTHEAQGAVVAILGIEVKGHGLTEERLETFICCYNTLECTNIMISRLQ